MAKITTFAQLEKVGGIVSRAPVKREITWKAIDPETAEEVDYEADIFLLKLGSGVLAEIIGKREPDREEIALWISKSLMLQNEKGKLELISYEKAYQLDSPLRGAVWKEISILCGMEKKALPALTNSSANSSPEASEDERLKKLKVV